MDKDFEAARADLLSQMEWSSLFAQLFSLLPELAFFMKDIQGRFIMSNRRACEFCRAASESEVIGKTDYDFFDHTRAQIFRESDLRVMTSGKPILNEISLAPDLGGSDRLIDFSKIPVHNLTGEIIGVAGIFKIIQERESPISPSDKLGEAVKTLHDNYAEQIDFKNLAKISGMSYNHFSRQFKSRFNLPPREYLTRIRIQSASIMLEQTNETVTSIALQCGFYDHSHLSRVFSDVMGMSPSLYRSSHIG